MIEASNKCCFPNPANQTSPLPNSVRQSASGLWAARRLRARAARRLGAPARRLRQWAVAGARQLRARAARRLGASGRAAAPVGCGRPGGCRQSWPGGWAHQRPGGCVGGLRAARQLRARAARRLGAPAARRLGAPAARRLGAPAARRLPAQRA